MRHSSLHLTALFLTTVGLIGCGDTIDDMPEIGAVTGTVTVDGAPGANLIVSFQPEGGRPSMGTTGPDGKYELVYSRTANGAKIGPNLVTISTDVADEDYESSEGEEDSEAGSDAEDSAIPAKYNTLASENPDMTVQVAAGENVFNFDVKTEE